MDELQNVQNETGLPELQNAELQKAVLLHNRVMADSRAAADAIVALAGDLKQMRDSGLYRALGAESFDEYCNVTAGIGARQGYNFIRVYEKLGEKYMSAHSELGITKLLEIVEVTPGDREALAAENDLAGMSVKEVKALIAEKQGLAEQLSLLTGQMRDVQSEAELAAVKAQDDANAAALRYKAEADRRAADQERLEGLVAHLQEEVAAAKAAPVEAAAAPLPDDFEQQLQAAREQATAEAKAEMKQKLAAKLEKQEKAAAAAAAEAKAALEADKAAAIEQARKEAADAAEQAARQAVEAAQAEKAAAAARAEELTKQLAVASSTETVQFGIYFEQLQGNISSMDAILRGMRTAGKAEQADKLTAALRALLQNELEGMA